MKGFSLGEAFALVIYLAIVFTMVRPGSQGPALVQTFGNTLARIITAATGSGSWSGGGPSSGGTLYA